MVVNPLSRWMKAKIALSFVWILLAYALVSIDNGSDNILPKLIITTMPIWLYWLGFFIWGDGYIRKIISTPISALKGKIKPKDNGTIVETKDSRLNWFLWWRINETELERQVSEYSELKFYQSARGISILFLLFSAVFSFVFAITGAFGFGKEILVDGAIFAVLAIFIFYGYSWANLFAMALWTFEKGYALYQNFELSSKVHHSPIMVLIFWVVYMHAFYLSYKVEKIRDKRFAIKKSNKTSIFLFVIFIATLFVMWGVYSSSKKESKTSSIDFGREITALNKDLPKMVDKETRLQKVSFIQNQVVEYQYTLINAENISYSDLKDAQSSFKSNLINSLKKSTHLNIFKDNNLIISYKYFDKDGNFLYNFFITPHDYNVKSSELSDVIDYTASLSAAEKLDIKYKLDKCWNGSGFLTTSAVVDLGVQLDKDNRVEVVEILNEQKYASNAIYRNGVDRARLALYNPKCNPLDISRIKGNNRKYIIVNFSP